MIRLLPTSLPVRFYMAFRNPFLMFLIVLVIGSTGCWIVSDYKASPLDCIYMTFITVATIGFGIGLDGEAFRAAYAQMRGDLEGFWRVRERRRCCKGLDGGIVLRVARILRT